MTFQSAAEWANLTAQYNYLKTHKPKRLELLDRDWSIDPHEAIRLLSMMKPDAK